jgi:hypothetical protein
MTDSPKLLRADEVLATIGDTPWSGNEADREDLLAAITRRRAGTTDGPEGGQRMSIHELGCKATRGGTACECNCAYRDIPPLAIPEPLSPQARAVLSAAEAWAAWHEQKGWEQHREEGRLMGAVRAYRASLQPVGVRPEEGWYWLRYREDEWRPHFIDEKAFALFCSPYYEVGHRISIPKDQ